jgi:hypothetical protein
MSEAATDKPVTDKPIDAVEEVEVEKKPEVKPEVTEEATAKEEEATAPVAVVKAEGADDTAAAVEKETPAVEKEEEKVENDNASEDSESPKAGGDSKLLKELDDEAPKTFPQVVSDVVGGALKHEAIAMGLRRQGAVACVRRVSTRIQRRPAAAAPMRLLRVSCLFLTMFTECPTTYHSHFLSNVPKTANGDLVERGGFRYYLVASPWTLLYHLQEEEVRRSGKRCGLAWCADSFNVSAPPLIHLL